MDTQIDFCARNLNCYNKDIESATA